ncbi:MAG: SCO family protein [Edaphobacter sp.]
MRLIRSGLVLGLGVVLGVSAYGQLPGAEKPLGATAQVMPQYLKNAGLVERLNQPLPLEATFVDDTGKTVALKEYFHERPVAMALVYFKCGMLCPQVLHGMATALKATGFVVGKDYDVVVASIDPMDTPVDASAAKKTFLAELGDASGAGSVHFLTGQPDAIAALSGATGFHYVRVPGPDGKMDQFAHSSVVMFATPDGRMSEYLSGIDYPSRDVRLALVNASQHKIGTVKDLFLLYCCNYVPSAGRYTVDVLRLLGIAAMVTMAGIALAVFLLMRKKPMPGGGAAA